MVWGRGGDQDALTLLLETTVLEHIRLAFCLFFQLL